jgi:hypothetical protein
METAQQPISFRKKESAAPDRPADAGRLALNEGFIDEELVPTAGKIPAKLWFPVKDAALKYARTPKG